MAHWTGCMGCPYEPRKVLENSVAIDPYSQSIFNADMVEYLFSDQIEGENPKAFVYFVSDSQFVKIGHTTNLKDRMTTLQIGNPRQLSLLYVIPCKNKAAAKNVEKGIHGLYSAYEENGEWFRILDKIDKKIWTAYFGAQYYSEERSLCGCMA